MFNNNSHKSLLDDIIITIPQIRDSRGALSFLQTDDLEFKRVFWIYNVPQGAERGGHAHRTCSELLLAAHGSFDLELNDGSKTVCIHLDRPDKAVLIRPMVWCRLFNFSSDFVGLCLASQEYLPDGYINSFEEFQTK